MCPAPPADHCVLVVDDQATIRKLLTKHLERHGLEVITAEDGDRALAVFRSQSERIALVILDMVMPRTTGLEVLLEIRRTHPDLPVLLSSGYDRDADHAEALAAGVQGFIAKPFTLRDLTAQVRHALGITG